MGTLTAHIQTYMASRRALGIYGPKSQRVVAPRLHNFARHYGNRPINQLSPAAIERWLDTLNHLAVNTKACYLVSVRQFTGWLCETGHITTDPCVGIAAIRRTKATPRALPATSIALILAACRTDREQAMIWLGVGLGLRRMEIAQLRWEHYDDRAGLIEIRHSKHGSERVLPVPAEVAAALEKLRGGGQSGPVIRSELDPSQPITVERVGLLMAKVMRRAGVKRAAYDGCSAHALRHTAASDVLDACQDLRTVQAMLGHQHLTSTAIYLRRASAGQIRSAMEGRSYDAA